MSRFCNFLVTISMVTTSKEYCTRNTGGVRPDLRDEHRMSTLGRIVQLTVLSSVRLRTEKKCSKVETCSF